MNGRLCLRFQGEYEENDGWRFIINLTKGWHRTWAKLYRGVKELNQETANQNRTIRRVTTAATTTTTTAAAAAVKNSISERNKRSKTERTEQLAPNCQHPSPQKIPGNEKATCQTSSSSLSLTPSTFSFYLLFASSSLWRVRAGCHDSFSTPSPSVRCRQRWVCTPLPQSLLHSVYLSSSSLVFLCSVLNGLNEDMLLKGSSFECTPV